MQPPFDLNLLLTSEGRDPREAIAEAEAARQLACGGVSMVSQLPGTRILRAAFSLAKELVVAFRAGRNA